MVSPEFPKEKSVVKQAALDKCTAWCAENNDTGGSVSQGDKSWAYGWDASSDWIIVEQKLYQAGILTLKGDKSRYSSWSLMYTYNHRMLSYTCKCCNSASDPYKVYWYSVITDFGSDTDWW